MPKMAEQLANHPSPVSQSSNKDGSKTRTCVTVVEAAAGTIVVVRNMVMLVMVSVDMAEEAKLKQASSKVPLQPEFIGQS